MATRLRTTRLDLDVFTADDAEELHVLFSDPLTHTVGAGPHTAVQQTRDWVARHQQRHVEHGLAWCAARDRASDALVGCAGLFLGRTGSEPEIGYEVAVARRGRGVAMEVAVAELGEVPRAGWPTLWATVRPQHAASRAVLPRLGFVEDGVRDDEGGPLAFLRREVLTTVVL